MKFIVSIAVGAVGLRLAPEFASHFQGDQQIEVAIFAGYFTGVAQLFLYFLWVKQ